jgi:hypothetical protein
MLKGPNKCEMVGRGKKGLIGANIVVVEIGNIIWKGRGWA